MRAICASARPEALVSSVQSKMLMELVLETSQCTILFIVGYRLETIETAKVPAMHHYLPPERIQAPFEYRALRVLCAPGRHRRALGPREMTRIGARHCTHISIPRAARLRHCRCLQLRNLVHSRHVLQPTPASKLITRSRGDSSRRSKLRIRGSGLTSRRSLSDNAILILRPPRPVSRLLTPHGSQLRGNIPRPLLHPSAEHPLGHGTGHC